MEKSVRIRASARGFEGEPSLKHAAFFWGWALRDLKALLEEGNA